MKINDKVMLKPGTSSYKHFINYMPVDGVVIEINLNNYQGKSYRPIKVKFSDDRESWYHSKELKKVYSS